MPTPLLCAHTPAPLSKPSYPKPRQVAPGRRPRARLVPADRVTATSPARRSRPNGRLPDCVRRRCAVVTPASRSLLAAWCWDRAARSPGGVPAHGRRQTDPGPLAGADAPPDHPTGRGLPGGTRSSLELCDIRKLLSPRSSLREAGLSIIVSRPGRFVKASATLWRRSHRAEPIGQRSKGPPSVADGLLLGC